MRLIDIYIGAMVARDRMEVTEGGGFHADEWVIEVARPSQQAGSRLEKVSLNLYSY